MAGTRPWQTLQAIALALALVLALGLLAPAPARAATSVQVLETYPAGEHVTLARNQHFNLRLAYTADEPVGIWVRPYFRGKPARTGTSTSQQHVGRGETMAWFFFMQPGDEVDEIRIIAGDGRPDTTHLMATLPMRVVGSNETATDANVPAWVAELGAQAKAAQRQAYEERMNTPTSAGTIALYNGFMLGTLTLALLGIGGPIWMLRRWRGGWRLAALVPAALMAFVVLRIVIGGLLDPTSHNLWPFEILLAAAASTVACVLLVIGHRLSGAGRRA